MKKLKPMKKLLLILLCVPLISMSQTSEDYYEEAANYARQSKWELAIDNYTKSIKLQPDNAIAYYSRGVIYGRYLPNYEKAISDFTKAIKIYPDYHAAFSDRGLVYALLGNYEKAISDFTKAIEINPNYARAYRNRGISKESAGLSYCSDYMKACNLGKSECCEWYSNQCK